MHRLRLRAIAVAVVLAASALLAAGCHPLLDGGWDGTATCNGNAFPLSAIFNETGEGDVEGTVYIEGIFGGFIAKGVIENGARDPDDGSYDFNLESDGDEAPDFDIEMEYADDEAEELEGTVDILDGNGETESTCELDLDRVSVND
jgi:hypothetical protein